MCRNPYHELPFCHHRTSAEVFSVSEAVGSGICLLCHRHSHLDHMTREAGDRARSRYWEEVHGRILVVDGVEGAVSGRICGEAGQC